jgi:hypothetical protein
MSTIRVSTLILSTEKLSTDKSSIVKVLTDNIWTQLIRKIDG